jgi:hypothetical protein
MAKPNPAATTPTTWVCQCGAINPRTTHNCHKGCR